jgi:hypothetical protein
MAVDAQGVRERAWVERRGPAETGLDEEMWTAIDPVTDCTGAGRVEAEAVGNLIAVVAEFERRDDTDPLMKVPGRIITRPGGPGTEAGAGAASASLFDDLRSLF